MAAAPVQPLQRIQYLDVIRGFAITGVLLAYVFWNLGNEPVSAYTSFDRSLDKIMGFLIDSKCYTILANLFAVGFVVHMSKADNHTASMHIFRRRLLGLILFGIAHALFLRNGDVLVQYALLTFLVSFLYSASNRTIVTAIIITYFLQIGIYDITRWLNISFPQPPVAGGNYWVENFQWVKYWYAIAILNWETTLIFLLTGLLLGRKFIQNKKELSPGQLISVVVTGFAVGLASYWVINKYSDQIGGISDIGDTFLVRRSIYMSLTLIHRVSLAAAYAGLFYLLLTRFNLNSLAVLGRTSLTNYILQAVIIVPVSLLFNLFDHITPSRALVMTVSIWIIQVLVSTWWLKHYRFGPLEWILRRFTYGKSLNSKTAGNAIELVVLQERK